jgi:hypothetical protein
MGQIGLGSTLLKKARSFPSERSRSIVPTIGGDHADLSRSG